MFEQSLRNN